MNEPTSLAEFRQARSIIDARESCDQMRTYLCAMISDVENTECEERARFKFGIAREMVKIMRSRGAFREADPRLPEIWQGLERLAEKFAA
jgi:hypothetical protein